MNEPKPLFPMGNLYMTAAVNVKATESPEYKHTVMQCLQRHSKCDWGDVCDEDKQSNDQALKDGGRLFSSYEVDPKIWIITEAEDETGNRYATTILFPEEY